MDSTSKQILSVMKKLSVDWCKDSTSHGLSNIVKASNIALKLVWLTCYLVSCSACIYLISRSISGYLSNQISTTISVIDEVPATFPTVSICFLDPLVTDDSGINAEIARLLAANNVSLNGNTGRQISLYTITASREISYYLSNLNKSEKLSYGNTMDNSMFFCKFNSMPCESSIFEWYFDFNLGNCYKFNSLGNYTVGKSGYLPSLQLQFVIGDSSSNISNYVDSGLRILVHNSTLSLPLVYEDGISLSPGFNYDIKVSRTYYNRLGTPYSDCLKDLTNNSQSQTEVMKIMFNDLNITTYSQQYCENYVFQQYLADGCECVNPAYPYFNESYPRCIDSTKVPCQDGIFETIYSNPDLYFANKCPKECDFFQYDLQISESSFPTQWFYESSLGNAQTNAPANSQTNAPGNAPANAPANTPDNASSNSAVTDRVKKITSYDDAKKNFLAFNLYYRELSYVLIEETPYWDIFLLMSNIGGNLALFVGMSLLSFVEIFELIFVLIEYLVLSNLKKKKTTPENEKLPN